MWVFPDPISPYFKMNKRCENKLNSVDIGHSTGCSYESNKLFGLMIVRAVLIARSPSKWPEGF